MRKKGIGQKLKKIDCVFKIRTIKRLIIFNIFMSDRYLTKDSSNNSNNNSNNNNSSNNNSNNSNNSNTNKKKCPTDILPRTALRSGTTGWSTFFEWPRSGINVVIIFGDFYRFWAIFLKPIL
jgi:hypothetical protein